MIRSIACLACAATLLMACNTKVQQMQPPRIADDESGGADMMAEPEAGPKPIIVSKNQKRLTCCQQCVDALGKDRSGQDPKTIPCVDMTADMEEDCVVWFRSNSVQASDAASCVDEAKKAVASEKPEEN